MSLRARQTTFVVVMGFFAALAITGAIARGTGWSWVLAAITTACAVYGVVAVLRVPAENDDVAR